MESELFQIHIFNTQQEAQLPSFIEQSAEGLMVRNVVEGKEGPYDTVYDFAWSRKSLREQVPWIERVRKNSEVLLYASLEDSDVGDLMKEITRINVEQNPEKERQRLLYQCQLYKVYKLMKPYFSKHLEQGRTIFFPPKNGGDLIRAFFEEMRVINDQEDVVDFELKRVLLNDGRLMVGVIDGYYPERDYQTAVILDDCLASDTSIATTQDIIKRRYPSVKNTIIVVSAASQRGVETLLQGKNLSLFTAVPVFAMTDNYYLLRTPEEGYPQGTYFVGDMGKWAKPLPAEYNILAPWNSFR